MTRLYQLLYRWASLIFSGSSRINRPITSRRVVTVELEERVVVFRSGADQPPRGDQHRPKNKP
jgi:hypothetical protein